MNIRHKKNAFITILSIISLLMIAGISYAYFTANTSGGDETTSIEVKGGRMTIYYDGGDDINLSNIIPDDHPVTTKTFTVTGFNNTEIEMAYKISFIVEENTFSEEALKYKLISTNTDSNGTAIPSITEFTDISSGASTIEFGIGAFDVPTDGDKIHTYNLEIYFPNQDYNQNEDQNKQIKAYVLTENYMPPKLGNEILAQGGGKSAIEAKETPNFSVINGTSGLYASVDEYGTSYYYRGIKEELNNNLIWGGFQWKIVRINGDGSIRLIYNGTEGEFNLNSAVNDAGIETQISTSAFNANNTIDAKYVGYMYGGANGVASKTRDGSISTAATFNETSTAIKNSLDTWYQNNISGNLFESQVVNNLFCNDRQLQSEVGGAETGPGYGFSSQTTRYAPYYRLYMKYIPTLKCGLQNDQFTTNDSSEKGNGNLIYPVGLLTSDESSMAGLGYNKPNSTNYLYTNQSWWSISPYFMAEGGYATAWFISGTGILYFSDVTAILGVRPVISVSFNVPVSGTGSATDPYRAF